MTDFILWTIIVILLLVLFGREVLLLQEARREKADAKKDFHRFRSRTKGLGILLFLFTVVLFGSRVEPYLLPREILVYYLNCFIALIWVLIVVAREFHEITTGYLTLRQEVTIDTLKQIQEEVTKRQNNPDDRAIPGFNFRKKQE